MIKITLKEFLTEGRLGDIVFGIEKRDLQQVLGYPDAFSDPKSMRQIWKYGSLQVSFENNILDFIGIYFQNQERLPAQLEITGYFPTKLAGFTEFKQYLTQEGIPFEVNSVLTFESQKVLVVGLGIDVIFNNTNELDSIQHINKQSD